MNFDFTAINTDGNVFSKDGYFPKALLVRAKLFLPSALMKVDIDGQYDCLEFYVEGKSIFNRKDIEDTLAVMAPYIRSGCFVLMDEDGDFHKWEFKNGIWEEYEREWEKVPNTISRIVLPLPGDRNMVAVAGESRNCAEIFVGFETLSTGWWSQSLLGISHDDSDAAGRYQVSIPNSGITDCFVTARGFMTVELPENSLRVPVSDGNTLCAHVTENKGGICVGVINPAGAFCPIATVIRLEHNEFAVLAAKGELLVEAHVQDKNW